MPHKLSSDKEVLRFFKQYYTSATGQAVADPHHLAATTAPAAATAPSTPRLNTTTASASTVRSNTTQATKPSLSRRRSSTSQPPSTPPPSPATTTSDIPHTTLHAIYTTLKPADLKSFGSVGSSHRTRSGRESTWASDANEFEAEDDFPDEFSGFGFGERGGFQKFFF